MGKEFNDKMIEQASVYNKNIAKLKKKSSYYPNIYFKTIGDTIYASTLVRICRYNKWYAIHCVHYCHIDDSKKDLITQILTSAHTIQYLYIPVLGIEKLDKNQESEESRLEKLINP